MLNKKSTTLHEKALLKRKKYRVQTKEIVTNAFLTAKTVWGR